MGGFLINRMRNIAADILFLAQEFFDKIILLGNTVLAGENKPEFVFPNDGNRSNYIFRRLVCIENIKNGGVPFKTLTFIAELIDILTFDNIKGVAELCYCRTEFYCMRVFREFLVPCKSTTYASRLLKRYKRETKCTEIVPSLFLGYKGTNFPRNNQKFVGEYNFIAEN